MIAFGSEPRKSGSRASVLTYICPTATHRATGWRVGPHSCWNSESQPLGELALCSSVLNLLVLLMALTSRCGETRAVLTSEPFPRMWPQMHTFLISGVKQGITFVVGWKCLPLIICNSPNPSNSEYALPWKWGGYNPDLLGNNKILPYKSQCPRSV